MDNEKKTFYGILTDKYMPKTNFQGVWSILHNETGNEDAEKGRWMRELKEIKVGLVRVLMNSHLEHARKL